MRFTKLAAALAAIVLGSTLTLAADKRGDTTDKTVRPDATTNKANEKGAQGAIILQNKANKAADKGAKGGIILQNEGAAKAAGGAR